MFALVCLPDIEKWIPGVGVGQKFRKSVPQDSSLGPPVPFR
jgi:hypothetical protein